MTQDPTYPLVPIVNFFACILVLASISNNIFHSWNVGVCSFATWVVVMAFTKAVDSIIWADNVENVAPVWCDIVTRLEIGSNAAITIASLVIIRRLSIITRRCDPASEKRHISSLLVDLSLCLGAPILFILLSYVVQPIRFSIIEEIGCIGAGVNAGLTILLVGGPPLIFCVISLALYSPRLIWVYVKHREPDDLLASYCWMEYHSFRNFFRANTYIG